MNIKIVKIFKLKTCIFIFLFYNIKTLIIFLRKMNLEKINTRGEEETKKYRFFNKKDNYRAQRYDQWNQR